MKKNKNRKKKKIAQAFGLQPALCSPGQPIKSGILVMKVDS